jgi:hypothetical protein
MCKAPQFVFRDGPSSKGKIYIATFCFTCIFGCVLCCDIARLLNHPYLQMCAILLFLFLVQSLDFPKCDISKSPCWQCLKTPCELPPILPAAIFRWTGIFSNIYTYRFVPVFIQARYHLEHDSRLGLKIAFTISIINIHNVPDFSHVVTSVVIDELF